MKKIKVIDIIHKKIGVSTDDAQMVHDIVFDELNHGHKVELSFEGIELLISHFLNVSVGGLYRETKFNIVDNDLTFTGLSDDDLELLEKRVIPTAKKHFANSDNCLKIDEEV
jgi:hypothetical protein